MKKFLDSKRCLPLFAFLKIATSGNAATLTVNVAGDANTASGGMFTMGTLNGDLRGTLQYINFNPGAHDIVFDLPAMDSNIALTAYLPPINIYDPNTLTFDGTNGGNQITLSGGGARSVLSARQGTISISNLTISNGA